jgi:hypothetical protein
LYSYHSFRLLIPLLLLCLAVLFWKKIWKQRKYVISGLLLIIVLGFPIFQNFFFSGSGTGSRLSMVTIFSPDAGLIDDKLKHLAYDYDQGDAIGSM